MPTPQVLNKETSSDLWKYSNLAIKAEWPPANQPKSPCPTLKVVGAFTAAANAREEAKRMKPMPGMVGGMSSSLMRGSATVADKVVGGTIGKAFKGVQGALLGGLPQEAVGGSFQKLKSEPKEQPKSGGRFARLRFWKRRGAGAPAEAPAAAALAKIAPVAAPEALVDVAPVADVVAKVEAQLREARLAQKEAAVGA